MELSGDIASCSAARRFVEECLAGTADDLRANAALLVSEIVTNAVLHARAPIILEVRREGGAFRVSVSDRSTTLPAEKGYRADDATGHGLQIVDRLAAAWGWRRTRTGKIVWFDLPVPIDDTWSPGTKRRTYDDPYPGGTPIALIDAPIAEMIRTAAHYDAIYREFRLILELDASHLQSLPGRLLSLIGELGRSFMGFGRPAADAWHTGVREHRDAVDLHFRIPVEAGPVVARYNQLLDEADDFCRQAKLLTIPPTEEALHVRRWAFGQVVVQCLGEPPTPWSQWRQ
jgi:anti-sigma regulatory factor (Ser/Thr protein kinase)